MEQNDIILEDQTEFQILADLLGKVITNEHEDRQVTNIHLHRLDIDLGNILARVTILEERVKDLEKKIK